MVKSIRDIMTDEQAKKADRSPTCYCNKCVRRNSMCSEISTELLTLTERIDYIKMEIWGLQDGSMSSHLPPNVTIRF